MKILRLLVLLSFLVPARSSFALELKGLLGINAEFGGDTFIFLVYSDGSTSSINAGQGLVARGGLDLRNIFDLGPITFDAEATLGVKYTGVNEATNATGDLVRFPLELLGFVRWEQLRLGAGPTFHFGNSFTGSGPLTSWTTGIDPAWGASIQLEYLFGPHVGLGARYTSITYHIQNPQYSSVNKGNRSGSSFGGELTYYF